MDALLPYLNTGLLLAVLGYVVKVEHRLTRLEGLQSRVRALEGVVYGLRGGIGQGEA